MLLRARTLLPVSQPPVENGAVIKMVEFLQPAEYVIFKGFGQRDIVR